MKKINYTIKNLILILSSVLLLTSCQKKLTPEQQLFLDFAKLEDKYNNTLYYNNFDLNSVYIEQATYSDNNFNISNFRSKLKTTLKLYSDGYFTSPDFEGKNNIDYPFEYKLKKNDDKSADIKFSIFVPKSFSAFSIKKTDLGKPIVKNGIEFVLLEMTKDGATLLLKDLNIKKNYTNFNNESNPQKILNNDNLFYNENDITRYNKEITEDDSLSRINVGRVQISLSDKSGRTIVSAGKQFDLRNCLNHRKQDLENEKPELDDKKYLDSLRPSYYKIFYEFTDKKENSANIHNPIYIVNLRGLGNIENIDILTRSIEGNIETVALENRIIEDAIETQERNYEFLPIMNITEKDLQKVLKINIKNIYSEERKSEEILLYLSLPNIYNLGGYIGEKYTDLMICGVKDTFKIKNNDQLNYSFKNYTLECNNNSSTIQFNKPNFKIKKITGKITFKIPYYYDEEYSVKNLPPGATLSKNGMRLMLDMNNPFYKKMITYYAFRSNNKLKPISFKFAKESDRYTNIKDYDEKPEIIIIRFAVGGKNGGLYTVYPFEKSLD